jgi:long-chain fatty acid transport protein
MYITRRSITRRGAVASLPFAFVSALAAVIVPEGSARASGFLTDQFGSDQGQPALANTYSVYFNPGALAGMHGTEITVDGVLYARSLDYNRSASALSPSGGVAQGNPTYTDANTGQATLFNVLAAPFAGFATDFGGSKFRLGLAAYVPFGGAVSWGKNSAYSNSTIAPGAYDGPQRWSTISASTSSIYSTLAGAYRFDKARLGIGVSFSVIDTTLADTRARNADGSDDVTVNGQPAEGRSYFNVSGVQVGAAAGVYWDATADGALRIGASYTSQPNFGAMRLSGNFALTATGPNPTPADLLQQYPDIIRLGAAWRVRPDVEVRLDGNWQRWSHFNSQCIVAPGASCPTDSTGVALASATGVKLDLPRDFKDSYKARLGVGYWVTPETELFASGAWESAPVGKDHEDPLIFDSMRVEGTLGARHAFSKHVYASLSYTYVYLVPLTVNDSAYNNPNNPAPSLSPSTNGSYSSEIYIFDAAVSYRF